VFCHQYPTGTCGWSNPTVRELSGQRSLALRGGHRPARRDGDCQHHGGRELGLMGRANICESPINVVTVDKPKMLRGLNQKVRDRNRSFALSCRRHNGHRRTGGAHAHRGTHAERGKPDALPRGTACREGRPWGSGYMRMEEAKAGS